MTNLSDWPEGLSVNMARWTPCQSCEGVSAVRRRSIYSPQVHCGSCLPSVTHTRLGPCLILGWDSGSGDVTPLTVDLVPVFPVRVEDGRGMLSLFDAKIETLLRRKPENWCGHFVSTIEKDRILPESFLRHLEEAGGSSTHNVALKILNYGLDCNCVIRPAQVLDTKQIRLRRELREVYAHLKALRLLLDVRSTTSYFMKKIVLSEEVWRQILSPESTLPTLGESLHHALCHPDLRGKFKGKVDLQKWADDICARKERNWKLPLDGIPLNDRRRVDYVCRGVAATT